MTTDNEIIAEGPDGPKPAPEQAWLHPDGRVWVESGPAESRKLHLAGWSDGINPVDPQTGDDLRHVMKPLLAPLTLGRVTDEDLAEYLHRLTAETALDLGFANPDETYDWSQAPHEAREHLRAIAKRTLETLRATFTFEYGEELRAAREEAMQLRMQMVAVESAARGHWSAGLSDIIEQRGHPYWSEALDAVALLAAQPTATAATRPDSLTQSEALVGHTWIDLGEQRFVCARCPADPQGEQGMSRWPCPGALAVQPSLAHYNEQYPIGTLVWFKPNGVGDDTLTRTRTPVWLGPNDQPYVSVKAYPPQAGAAVKLSDLRKTEIPNNDQTLSNVHLQP